MPQRAALGLYASFHVALRCDAFKGLLLAGGTGFEPVVVLPTDAFQAPTLSLSAIHPDPVYPIEGTGYYSALLAGVLHTIGKSLMQFYHQVFGQLPVH